MRNFIFDAPESVQYVKARQDTLHKLLPALRGQISFETALDVGCGVGYFSQFLCDLDLQVVAVDGRPENVEEAQRRYPDVTFRTANVEDPAVRHLGNFDLVVCFGLLYHLENPFVAIRSLFALTQKVLLVESMCVPGARAILDLQDEGRSEDQGLNYVAFYPSESCLVRMLYRAGFPHVYCVRHFPDHGFFRDTVWRKRHRTMLAASKVPLNMRELSLVVPPSGGTDPWLTPLGRLRNLAGRLLRSSPRLRRMMTQFRPGPAGGKN